MDDDDDIPAWAHRLRREILATVHEALDNLEDRLMTDIHAEVAALKQAVTDAIGRVDAEVAALEAKITAGTATAQDLTDLKTATDQLAALAQPTGS